MAGERIIASDTAVSISPEIALNKGIPLIPLHITWSDESQSLDTEITPKEFYNRMGREMSQGMKPPKTSAPNPNEFFEFYQQLYQQGAIEIGSIHVTSKKSAVWSCAVEGAKLANEAYPDLTIQVIDSQGLSLTQWFLVEAAVEMLKQGLPLTEVASKVLELVPNAALYASISSLKNLKASGRVSGATNWVASTLNLSLLAHLNNGDLELLLPPARGIKQGRKRVEDYIRKDIDKKGLPAKLGVIYTGDPEIGEELKGALSDIWQDGQVELVGPVEAGPILGVHAGPGAGAIAAFWDTKK